MGESSILEKYLNSTANQMSKHLQSTYRKDSWHAVNRYLLNLAKVYRIRNDTVTFKIAHVCEPDQKGAF